MMFKGVILINDHFGCAVFT